jgi:hypothetical protein
MPEGVVVATIRSPTASVVHVYLAGLLLRRLKLLLLVLSGW